MAKSKTQTVKDLRAHFFMSIRGTNVDIIYEDDITNGAGLGAAFASVMEQDENIFNIISAALLTVLDTKDKYKSKTAKKVVKTPVKAAKKK